MLSNFVLGREQSRNDRMRYDAMETSTNSRVNELFQTPAKDTPRHVITETPTTTLVRKTENAIQQYLEHDCVRNIPLIQQLEDISYTLWVESNTAFLDESFLTSCADEDEWLWDEDCFFESPPRSSDAPSNDGNISICSLEESCSSIGSSVKPCDETDCSVGYLASCESSFSDYSTSIRGPPQKSDATDDWVIIDVERELDNGSDWLVLSMAQNSECSRIKTETVEECFDYVKPEIDRLAGNVDDRKDCSDDEDNGSDDWTVLSMEITEVQKRRTINVLEYSDDSGIKSPDSLCAKPSMNFCNFTNFSEQVREGFDSSWDFTQNNKVGIICDKILDNSTCKKCRQTREEWIILCLNKNKTLKYN